jgi:DNA polymerase-3 subunit alpha
LAAASAYFVRSAIVRRQAEEVRARIQSVEPLDQAAAKMQMGLRVFLRNEKPIAGVARRLEPARNGSARNGVESTDGEVSMVLMLGNRSEVEVKLPGRFKVSPQIAGAIKAVTGVVTVEAL